jgi:ABC-type glycerol-3-phosphate transport system substrate-binding protein
MVGGTFDADGATGRSPVTRRGALIAGGTAAITALSGCSGVIGSGTTTTESPDGPAPPWTTDELAAHVEDGSTLTIYAGAGTPAAWENLVAVVNDEFDMNLEPEVFVSDGGDVAQRVIQERQAGRDQADIISQGSDLYDRLHRKGREAVGKYYEVGFDENYWFNDVLDDVKTESWYVNAYNGGPSTAMAINRDVFDELGLDVPQTWNDLFEDQYEGVETYLASYVVANRIGWIINHHAEQRGMEPMTWMEEMYDHLSFSGIESHTRGARAVGQGNAPFMFYNFPWTIHRVAQDFPVEIHFPAGIQALMSSGHLAINNEAPNPWAARFFVSAVLEKSVQRRLVHEGGELAPGRLDLDYSAQDPGPYMEQLLTADVTRIPFWEEREHTLTGEQATEEIIAL